MNESVYNSLSVSLFVSHVTALYVYVFYKSVVCYLLLINHGLVTICLAAQWFKPVIKTMLMFFKSQCNA